MKLDHNPHQFQVSFVFFVFFLLNPNFLLISTIAKTTNKQRTQTVHNDP